MLKMLMSDEFGGEEVVEAAKEKLRRAQILNDGGPPSNKEIAEIGRRNRRGCRRKWLSRLGSR